MSDGKLDGANSLLDILEKKISCFADIAIATPKIKHIEKIFF